MLLLLGDHPLAEFNGMLIGQGQEREAIPNGFDHRARLNRIGMGYTGIVQQARKIDSPLAYQCETDEKVRRTT
jgi:hypothetical protein